MPSSPPLHLPPHLQIPAPIGPNSGRTKPRQVVLNDELWELARQIGRGNASAGIRHLLTQVKEQAAQ